MTELKNLSVAAGVVCTNPRWVDVALRRFLLPRGLAERVPLTTGHRTLYRLTERVWRRRGIASGYTDLSTSHLVSNSWPLHRAASSGSSCPVARSQEIM